MTDIDRNSRRLRYAKFQFCFLGLSIFSWPALKLPSWRIMWVSWSGSCSRWRRSATVTRSPWGTMRNNRAVGGDATFATRTDVKDTRSESSNFTLWLPNSPENYRSWPVKRFLVRCLARLFYLSGKALFLVLDWKINEPVVISLLELTNSLETKKSLELLEVQEIWIKRLRELLAGRYILLLHG